MKKVLFALAIAGMFGFVACNNNKNVEEAEAATEAVETVAEEATETVENAVEEVIDSVAADVVAE